MMMLCLECPVNPSIWNPWVSYEILPPLLGWFFLSCWGLGVAHLIARYSSTVNDSIALRRAGRDWVSSLKKSEMLSAKRLILSSQFPFVTPLIKEWDRIVSSSGFMFKTNKRGAMHIGSKGFRCHSICQDHCTWSFVQSFHPFSNISS